MGSWMKCQEAGAPAGKLAPSRHSIESRRATLCLPLGLIIISKRQTWQTILVIAPLFASAAAAAHRGSALAAPYQAPSAPNLESSESWPLQNPVPGWKKTEEDLRIHSAGDHPLLHAIGRDLSIQSVLANTAERSHIANTPWGSNENVESKVVGRGLLSIASPVLQMDQESSCKGSDVVAPVSLAAQAKTTDVFPKGPSEGFRQPVITGTSSSLVLQAMEAGKMERSSPVSVLPTASLLLHLRAIRSLHLAPNTTRQTGWIRDLAPASTTSAAATVLTSENLTAHGHIPRAEQDPHEKWLSSTRMVNIDQVNVDHSSTASPVQTDFLNSQRRVEEMLYLTSVSAETLSASPQDSVSLVGTASPGIVGIKMKLLHSSTGIADSPLALMLHASTAVLSSSPPTPSSDAHSRMTHPELMTLYKDQERDSTEPTGRGPPADAAVPSRSPWPSLSHWAVASAHVTPPAFRTLMAFTDSREAKGFPTPQKLKPLAMSPYRHISTTVQPPHVSAMPSAAGGAHLDPENYTEVPLSSIFHYERSKIPPIHSVSYVVALTSSSNQSSMLESAKSQWSKATSELPSRNDSLTVTSGSPKTESSADVASNTINQLAAETTALIPHSSAAGMPGFGLPLATTPFHLKTAAVGTHVEVHLTLRYQNSQEKEHVRGSNLTSPPLHLGTATKQDDTPSSLWAGRTNMEWKDSASLVAEEHSGPNVASTHDAPLALGDGTISSAMSSQSWQASSNPPLGILHPGDAETEYTAPFLQAGSSEAATKSVVYGEQMKTESYERKEWTPAAAEVIPVFSSELPFTASKASPLDSDLISAKPKAYLAGKHISLPKRSDATPTPPPNSTPLAISGVTLLSKGPSEPETPAASTAAKEASRAIAHTLAAGDDSTLSSLSFIGTGEVTWPVGITSAGTARADQQTTAPLASTATELSSRSSSQLKLAIPASTHATAPLTSGMMQGRSSVTPAYGAASIDSSWGSTPGSTLKMHTEATEGQITGKEQVRPASTSAWRPDPKASTLSLAAASTTSGIAPLLPTRTPEVDPNTSAVTAPLGVVLGGIVPKVSTVPVPLAGDSTALHMNSTGYAYSSGSQAPASLSVSVTKSTQAIPVSVATTVLRTAPRILPDESMSTARTSFIPSQTTLARFLAASQMTLTRKVLAITLGLTNAKKDLAVTVLGTKVTSLKAIGTAVLTRAKSASVTQEDHFTRQLVLISKAPILSQSSRKEDRNLSTPALPLPAMHALPLWFRLTRIDYSESLKNKSSTNYKKLEKELKLTLNKMLSAYEGFVQTNILRFLNGSVMVESEAVFQAGGPIPTSSDIIRTIITEVESRQMDTFFDWRVDVKSLWSNGFSLANLEPEKLAVSFTVLGVGPRTTSGGAITWEYLESLKSQVIVLLGVRYAVQNISLAEVGDSRSGIDIKGEISVRTNTHVDVSWALNALMGLSNYSVDLTSLSINGSRLSVKVIPVSFLVTNRIFDERMMDRSSAEHQHITRDLSDTLMHILGKYENLLQVAIREITGGSLVCHADVIFQHPAPMSKDILQTLVLSVGPKDYLDSSSLQVDPFSFTVAGDGLEPPFTNPGIPGYSIAIIALCSLALIAFPILALLPKILGRKDKIIINRAHDPEAHVETFELDNPGFHTTVDEDDGRPSYMPTETVS